MTIFRCSLLVIFAILSNPTFSQITAPTATYSSVTQYTSSPQDDIFVFCDNIRAGIGELKAVSNDGTSGWTFTWTKWDSGTGTFAIPIPSVDTSSESILTNLPDGLYKVEATNGVNSFNDQAWVLNNSNMNPSILVTLNCVGVNVKSSFTSVVLNYIDIDSGDPADVVSGDDIVFRLKRDNEDEFLRATYVGNEVSFIDEEPFLGEKGYSISVKDQYGCVFYSDVVASETYSINAEFTFDPGVGEAPLEVKFDIVDSDNIENFEWFIYQDFDRIKDAVTLEDSLLVDGIVTDKDLVAYTYLHPGNYFVKLIASSENMDGVCIDEFYLKDKGTPIVVDTSLVQVPNVFTPNGDGRNDIFRVKSQSLKSFGATIINRWGRVVYEWKDPDGGWNGKINGKWATPGTYFYVITATGREELKKTYTKKGSFMLIRK
ncbi:gliding motility-associated C-terminal domain-containing protein [Labilibaculum euxinus]